MTMTSRMNIANAAICHGSPPVRCNADTAKRENRESHIRAFQLLSHHASPLLRSAGAPASPVAARWNARSAGVVQHSGR
jgi:hypothetical protein